MSFQSDVIMVWCTDSNFPRFGSGLLVAPGLVLTAKHIIEGASSSSWLIRRVGAKVAVSAKVTWMSGHADLAVMEIDEGVVPRYRYRFCSIEHDRPIASCSISGFPYATRNSANEARDYTVLGSLRREGVDGVSFSVPMSDAPVNIADWQGTSGAGVVATYRGDTRDVYGVIEEVRPQFVNGKLYVASLFAAVGDRLFEKIVSDRVGQPINVVSLDASVRSQAEAKYGFLSGIYKSVTEPSKEESIQSFEIDAAYDLTFEQVKDVIRGGGSELDRRTPRSMLPHPSGGCDRLLLYMQAPAGYGKTSFLKRLIVAAIEEGFVVFCLDAKKSGADWSSQEQLFKTTTQSGGNYQRFLQSVDDSEFRTIVVIDGLNEAKQDWDTIRGMLDQLSSNYDLLSVVVADRMNPERTSLPAGFIRATLLPVDIERVAEAGPREFLRQRARSRLLSVPFFLDKLYKMRTTLPNASNFGRADIIRDYLVQYGRLDSTQGGQSELDELSTQAMKAYRQGGLHLTHKAVGVDMARRLIDVGILMEVDHERVLFAHQLTHDFLVAHWLSQRGAAEWTRRNFDPATLDARSFDALELASELLGPKAEAFVLEVYDWNYRAALECILNLDAGLSGKASPLPRELKEAIFALRAEKMFDPFAHTRESATLRSRNFRSECGIDYSGLKTADELTAEVRSKFHLTDSASLYRDWRDLFTEMGPISIDRWASIQDSPLLGWTAASVFRRRAADDVSLVRHLVSLYDALVRAQPKDYRGGIVTRWRIVHVLGASDLVEAGNLLQQIVRSNNDDEWVLYGAVRSLVEFASRAATQEVADSRLGCLIDALPGLPAKVRHEARDVAMLADRCPPWWPTVYGKVLTAGMERMSGQSDERRAWQSRLQNLQNAVGSESR